MRAVQGYELLGLNRVLKVFFAHVDGRPGVRDGMRRCGRLRGFVADSGGTLQEALCEARWPL